jgi:hypothetical protein
LPRCDQLIDHLNATELGAEAALRAALAMRSPVVVSGFVAPQRLARFRRPAVLERWGGAEIRVSQPHLLGQFGPDWTHGTQTFTLAEYARLMRKPPAATADEVGQAFDSRDSFATGLPAAVRADLESSAPSSSAATAGATTTTTAATTTQLLSGYFEGSAPSLTVVSVGADGQGVLMHTHDRAWLVQLAGEKGWTLLPPRFPFARLVDGRRKVGRQWRGVRVRVHVRVACAWSDVVWRDVA